MLKLTNIVKEYSAGDSVVEALKGIDIEFRDNEFVSILGPSGCGKTTLLNIIGGLDRYTQGDLMINNRSTKEYTDADWDSYRNHSIGFVFQNYNLIQHQTVLSNVELALTLSGVSKAERRQRAVDVLTKVGLQDQIHKKPNQMSGGQMQRVAIARALINNPDILLADEPTGALDSVTSLQIMNLLKEIANDRLIIMVTHNPDLAEHYSTRIIKLLDGKVVDDSNPYHAEIITAKNPEKHSRHADRKRAKSEKPKKTSMSLITALSLSLNNLMTKKTRTFLTAFAGSIGIIGIALILSLQNGVDAYISSVEEDTLSSYPITIEQQSVDLTSMMSTMMESQRGDITHLMDKVYSSNIMMNMLESMTTEMQNNDLTAFKQYLESDSSEIDEYTTAIQYGYDLDLQVYKADTSSDIVRVNPSDLVDTITTGMGSGMMTSGFDVWKELIDNQSSLDSTYEVLAGRWPASYNEIVLIVDENNEISDMALYSLGLKDSSEITDAMTKLAMGEEVSLDSGESASFTYDEILGLTYKLVINTDYFQKAENGWVNRQDDLLAMKTLLENAETLQVVGIMKPSSDSLSSSETGSVGYTSALVAHVIDKISQSAIVTEQLADPDTDVFTGLPFDAQDAAAADAPAAFDTSNLSDEEKAYLSSLSEEELAALMESYAQSQPTSSESTFEDNMALFGYNDPATPSTISIYPIDFAAKETITDLIKEYNNEQLASGNEAGTISYTDLVGLLMSSVTTIINAISYILIAFVAISLVVSSIMIGIITYISVLERTKEIGILRSIGASKKDISSVFNAETLIVGMTAGIIGIGLTLLLTIPINLIIKALTDISGLSALPVIGAFVLILLSTLLTLIAGVIPSRIAARKDPVEALRSE